MPTNQSEQEPLNTKIFVTQPSLPPLEDFIPYLRQIWHNKVLTNGGPFHQQLESSLCEYLGVKYISLFNNGTIALLTALQALRVTGEVITTPYSFVATSHSLMWTGLKPVFVDIDRSTFGINPQSIAGAITEHTTAIMPVHCYGYPGNIDEIEEIGRQHSLKVIYDAAHAFGVLRDGKSILNAGDLSVLSFHATKVFNTFEGGAIVSHDLETKKRIDQLKNFGYLDELHIEEVGINGKLSEVNAAFGLVQLGHLGKAVERRRTLDTLYRSLLGGIDGLVIPSFPVDAESNFSYFPILIDDSFRMSRDQLFEFLKTENIFTRRYFYPLISDFPVYNELPSANPSNLPNARWVSSRILCLPLYAELQESQVHRICQLIQGKDSQ